MTCIELGETTKANYCKNILLTATLKDLEKKFSYEMMSRRKIAMNKLLAESWTFPHNDVGWWM